MAFNCTGNKGLIGGPAIIHIRSADFTRLDIKANITSMDPRNEVAQDASSGQGFTIQERNSVIAFELEDGCDLSLTDLSSVCNATITARLINAKAYAMREAWFATEDLSFSTEEGKVPVEFKSIYPMEEILGC